MKFRTIVTGAFLAVFLFVGSSFSPNSIFAADVDDIRITNCTLKAVYEGGSKSVVSDEQWSSLLSDRKNKLKDKDITWYIPLDEIDQIQWKLSITATNTRCSADEQNGVYAKFRKSNGDKIVDRNVDESPGSGSQCTDQFNLENTKTQYFTYTSDASAFRAGGDYYWEIFAKDIQVVDRGAADVNLCKITVLITDEPDDDRQEIIDTPFDVCTQIPSSNTDARAACDSCIGANGIWTSVGCLSTDGNQLLPQLVTIALGIAGGIALLMILSAAFMYSTSQGDPKRATDAKEQLTSAIIGLLFIIFSVTILEFIGVTILQIPGFG